MRCKEFNEKSGGLAHKYFARTTAAAAPPPPPPPGRVSSTDADDDARGRYVWTVHAKYLCGSPPLFSLHLTVHSVRAPQTSLHPPWGANSLLLSLSPPAASRRLSPPTDDDESGAAAAAVRRRRRCGGGPLPPPAAAAAATGAAAPPLLGCCGRHCRRCCCSATFPSTATTTAMVSAGAARKGGYGKCVRPQVRNSCAARRRWDTWCVFDDCANFHLDAQPCRRSTSSTAGWWPARRREHASRHWPMPMVSLRRRRGPGRACGRTRAPPRSLVRGRETRRLGLRASRRQAPRRRGRPTSSRCFPCRA